MRSKTATWFECKIRYDKVMEDGTQKKVNEIYVIDALSFSEAEERVAKELSSFISGDVEILHMKIARYREVLFSDDTEYSWFRVKVSYITIDERSGKEKSTSQIILVNADSTESAIKSINDLMKELIVEHRITSISSTNICDIFEYMDKD